MSDNLTLHQGYFDQARLFQFGSENLTYTITDLQGERTFSVPYQAIDTRNLSKVRVKNTPFVLKLSRLFAMGVVVAFVVGMENRPAGAYLAIGSFALYVLTLLLAGLGLFSASYTHVAMAPVPAGANSNTLSIIDDGVRDQILGELKKRSYEQLRTLYGKVNPNGDPNKEAGRMQWLKEREIISEAEYAEQLGRLRAPSNAEHEQREPLLN